MISTLITSLALVAGLGGGSVATEPPLTGTRWVVSALVDGAGVTPVATVRPAYLVVHPDGATEGYDTCNWVSATATVTDAATIAFDGFGTTKRLCHDSTFRVELVLTHVLTAEVAHRIEAGELWLVHPDGRGLVLRADGA